MNRFTVMLLALALAFFSGWLFANEITPPRIDDTSMAMWILTGVVSLVGAMMVSARG